MKTIKQPPEIIFGRFSAQKFSYPPNSLIITSIGAKKREWIEYLQIKDYFLFDCVVPNPSMEIVDVILKEFNSSKISNVIGIGGGSSLDVAKYVAFKMKKRKIMIPTTFGSGSEVTRISVLKRDGNKKSFHYDGILADTAIVDPFFIKDTPIEILKNSAIDACAQCTEGHDSKLGNEHTKFLCKKAFEILENAILHDKYEDLPLGALLSGLGFGNCSTTLGHALSYVYSNEGISHGHALAFTTTVAHKFNKSIFYERFRNLVLKLKFKQINLKHDLELAANLIMTDRKHLDYNPIPVTRKNIIQLLNEINSGKVLPNL